MLIHVQELANTEAIHTDFQVIQKLKLDIHAVIVGQLAVDIGFII